MEVSVWIQFSRLDNFYFVKHAPPLIMKEKRESMEEHESEASSIGSWVRRGSLESPAFGW
jgi:hypothetical protein